MRIGLIAPPWIPIPPPGYGGIEAVVDTLARALAAAGHEVLLAAAAGSTCPVERIPDLPAAEPATLGSSIEELRHTVLAYQEMKGVDLIHDHTLSGPLYRHRPAQTPLVTTAHNPFVGGLRDIYQAMALDVPIIAISHHQAGTAPEHSISRIIHHGIDSTLLPVGSGDGGYACFLGRMHPDKGLRQAIEVARLAGVPLRITARIHGPEEHEYFRTVIRPLLGQDAELMGELNKADKDALLGGAVALLNPIQWSEPFGMVMIEALATGTPVIATPRGSVPEIIDDGMTGFLAGSIQELAAALLKAPTLNRADCRDAAETRFSGDRMAADHLRFYQDVLAGAPRGSGIPGGEPTRAEFSA